MIKLLFSSIHPAPYINKIINVLEKKYEVIVVYEKRISNNKHWKNFTWKKGMFYDQISIISFILKVKRNDIAILGGWNNLYSIVIILLSKFLKTKIAVFSDYPMSLPIGTRYLLKKYVLFKNLDYIYCATVSTCEYYNKYYNVPMHKLKFFPYPYSVINNIEINSINDCRAKALLCKGAKIRVFIANNFIKRKGWYVLCEAFKKLYNNNYIDNFTIIIAGTGDIYEDIKNEFSKFAPNTRFLGWIEYEEYENYMNNTDVYIHGSLIEPFGIPPLDAMARGKLLISSDGVKSVQGLIHNGKNGFIYSAENSNELYEILASIKKTDIYTIGKTAMNAVQDIYNESVYYKAIDNS